MKTTLRLFALAASLCLASSCSDSSTDDPTPSTATLQGKWKGISMRVVEKSTTNQVVSDKTTAFPSGSYSIEITPTEFVVYSGTAVDKRNTYTYSNNVIHIGGTNPNNITVQTLEANRLILALADSSRLGENKLFSTFTYQR